MNTPEQLHQTGRLLIPGCHSPSALRFAFLNLRDHPRGTLMLQRLIAAGFVPTVVVDEESPLADAGRVSQLAELSQVPQFRPTPSTEDLCSAHTIRYETVSHHNDPLVEQLIRDADVHLAVLGDTRILKPHIIDSAPHGIVNVHPGLLPDVRGNNPYIWSVIHNLPQGATAHLINAGVDRGPILLARRIQIPAGADLPRLIHTLNELCADIVVETMQQIVEGTATLTPQLDDQRLTFREARPEVRALAASMLREQSVPPRKETVFETLESEVRSYCRSWPAVFDRAQGSYLYDEDGNPYLDFFSGAGSLNYGHNNPVLKRALLDYLERDGITHSLDMSTRAKRTFLGTLQNLVLRPRQLDYKVMFPGPTGTNAVEAALKLARKAKGRETIISFTNAFHGMSLGSLAVSGNASKRAGAGIPLAHGVPMPFDQYLDDRIPDFLWLDRLLEDPGSGLNQPAAVIVETVQGEGGVNVARPEWLGGLADLCKRRDLLLIVDDIQMGCGRTGPFFSFEDAGITPDIVTLSKSISGYGLPMSLLLFKPELDIWQPGEHNGTFRGNNPAFVTATAALETYWADDQTEKQTLARGEQVEVALKDITREHQGADVRYRGRGLVWGLEFADTRRASKVCTRAFELGLLMETSGPHSEVVKLLPAVTISPEELDEGLRILGRAVHETA